ncbi:ATP-dependent DNA ligase domain-containing protein (plasmid) [Rhizobium gallicum]|uniref:DNA ligase (ATP) n=1 Tax=Rhizobium gallicum TaxID=56730 RepID=A0A1L5NX47_9HYPH|nr:ATP-dependent DNA ligase domain-containing protein [Rhizobium gallicum]
MSGASGAALRRAWHGKLQAGFDRFTVRKPPVEYNDRLKGIVWVRPTPIAEIESRAWTHDGKLRQPPSRDCARCRKRRIIQRAR